MGLPSALVAVSPPAHPRRRAVVTDVDGTLMDSAHRLPPANRRALRRCLERGIPVVLATGKHRGPWVKALIAEVVGDGVLAASGWTLNAPGVFVQGLLVCGIDGRVVHRQLLPPRLVQLCGETARAHGWTVLAYTDDDRIVASREDPQLARLTPLQEPAPEVGPVDQVAAHKMLFLASPAEEITVRAAVAAITGEEASLTVAIPGMVEVLPRGASKADGVRVALDLLGVAPGDVLALGDGENDVELLQLVRQAGGTAAAVANARPALKEAANAVVASCDEGGWAEAVERWVLDPA